MKVMGRPLRAAEGGLIYHALNRANGRLAIFDDDGDFEAFVRDGNGDAASFWGSRCSLVS
jgi:hypothetical protein